MFRIAQCLLNSAACARAKLAFHRERGSSEEVHEKAARHSTSGLEGRGKSVPSRVCSSSFRHRRKKRTCGGSNRLGSVISDASAKPGRG